MHDANTLRPTVKRLPGDIQLYVDIQSFSLDEPVLDGSARRIDRIPGFQASQILLDRYEICAAVQEFMLPIGEDPQA